MGGGDVGVECRDESFAGRHLPGRERKVVMSTYRTIKIPWDTNRKESHTSIVDEDVEPTESLGQAMLKRLNTLLIVYIHLHRHDLASPFSQSGFGTLALFEQLDSILGPVERASGEDHGVLGMGRGREEGLGYGEADAGVVDAGDEDDGVVRIFEGRHVGQRSSRDPKRLGWWSLESLPSRKRTPFNTC